MSIGPVTEFTVRPVAPAQVKEEPIFGVRTPGDTDIASADDVAKAANALHYVPFVSQVYEAATGNTGSAAMKILGGALIGGPIGLIAGIANAIFEQEKGTSVVGAVASLFDSEPASQVAQAETAVEPVQSVSLAETKVVAAADTEILPPAAQSLNSAQAQDMAQKAQMQMASAMDAVGAPVDAQDSQVLALFGGQPQSAHRSYQKAQMLPYLRDVTSSQVI